MSAGRDRSAANKWQKGINNRRLIVLLRACSFREILLGVQPQGAFSTHGKPWLGICNSDLSDLHKGHLQGACDRAIDDGG